MPKMLREWIRSLGPLRLMLVLAALAVLVLRPAPRTPVAYSGWEMVPSFLAPVLTPMLFMVLLLDALMSAVMAGGGAADPMRLRRALVVDLALAALLVAWWWPYYRALGG